MNEREIFDRRTNFKARNMLHPIAVCADFKKSMASQEERPGFGAICTSFDLHGVKFSPVLPRLCDSRNSEHRKLNTAATRRDCDSHVGPADAPRPGFLEKCRDRKIDELRLGQLA